MNTGWWRRRWLSGRRVGLMLLWTILLLAAATAVNLVGIRLAGSIEGWQQWMDAHAAHFLVWRLLLYASTAWGWIWMRRRLLAREPGCAARRRLLRMEVAALLAVIALEISQFMRTG